MEVERLADANDEALRRELKVIPAELACPWRSDVAARRVPRSWQLANELFGLGAQDMLYPSLAPAATAGDVNLVLWRRQGRDGANVRVIHDDRRLGATRVLSAARSDVPPRP